MKGLGTLRVELDIAEAEYKFDLVWNMREANPARKGGGSVGLCTTHSPRRATALNTTYRPCGRRSPKRPGVGT